MPTSTARAFWTDVRLDVEGEINPAKFTTFKVAFLSAMLDVKDTTSDEATRILLSNLQRYPGIMSWVNRAESKEGESHPAFEISFGMPPLSREIFLQEFHAKTGGATPRTVECCPQGVWVVSLAHKGADEEKVAALHNRRLEEGRVISALHTVRPLTVPRILRLF